jgi:D-alanyl-lipoteichoic acid acyltransferase DltB (MBOAT superfamily)
MLFNSYEFILGFLPLALLGFFLIARLGRKSASVWLVGASLAFYSFWNPVFLPVLLISIGVNYSLSELIGANESRPRLRNALLIFTIAVNLTALVYYKYLFSTFGFLNDIGLIHFKFDRVDLPLGISFFTFTQIGYLIDTRQGVTKDRGLLSYLQFVTFFPHLIAGPILHNQEMMPQFADSRTYRFSGTNMAVGATIFIIGLLKKCVLADPTGMIVPNGFANASQLTMFAAWDVALSYSLQLYFDFSGYSDMAIGLARMFNISFPLNFNSPYKSASIIDYWQRWHMTLTRYLNLYLYNPIALAITRRRLAKGLKGSRKAYATIGGFSSMVLAPTFITMTLAGIWHGAGLQFIVFGLLHAFYLSINHAWRIFLPKRVEAGSLSSAVRHASNVLLTYLAVLVAAIFFRAPSCGAAVGVLSGMIGLRGAGSFPAIGEAGCIVALYVIVWGMPNTQQIMSRYEPALGKIQDGPLPWLRWQMNLPWAVVAGLGAIVGLAAVNNAAEFLYFQF